MDDESRFFLWERNGVITPIEFDPHEYSGPCVERDLWVTDKLFTKSEAIEISDIVNALVDDRRGRAVLMKRLLKLV